MVSKKRLTAAAVPTLAGIDVFDDTCAGHYALGQVADKWTLLLIYALDGGTKRYGQLQRQIRGISAKMLIQNLRKLETMRFLERTVHPVVPPMVEYTLTPLGSSFVKPLLGICTWAQQNLEELGEVREEQRRAAAKERKKAARKDPSPGQRQAPAALRKLAARRA